MPTAGILRSVSALWGLPMAPSMSVAEAGSQVRNFRKAGFSQSAGEPFYTDATRPSELA